MAGPIDFTLHFVVPIASYIITAQTLRNHWRWCCSDISLEADDSYSAPIRNAKSLMDLLRSMCYQSHWNPGMTNSSSFCTVIIISRQHVIPIDQV